jgi:hypothetical protein
VHMCNMCECALKNFVNLRSYYTTVEVYKYISSSSSMKYVGHALIVPLLSSHRLELSMGQGNHHQHCHHQLQ